MSYFYGFPMVWCQNVTKRIENETSVTKNCLLARIMPTDVYKYVETMCIEAEQNGIGTLKINNFAIVECRNLICIYVKILQTSFNETVLNNNYKMYIPPANKSTKFYANYAYVYQTIYKFHRSNLCLCLVLLVFV